MKNIRLYLFAWFGLVVIGILNGTLRVAGYSRFMPELTAHQVSTAVGIILFGLYVYFLSVKRPLASAKEALLVGTAWLLLTVAFEFLFGHYIAGNSWDRLLADYNILKGRLWILVLLWTFISPWFFHRIRRKSG